MAGLIIRTFNNKIAVDYLTLTSEERSAPLDLIEYDFKVNYSKYDIPGQIGARYQIISACYQPFYIKGELISQWMKTTPTEILSKLQKLVMSGEKVEIQIDNDASFGDSLVPSIMGTGTVWRGYFSNIKTKYYSSLRIGYELEFLPFDFEAQTTFKATPKTYGFSVSSIFGIISLVKDLATQTRAIIFGGGLPIPHMIGELATELRVFLATIDNKVEVINKTFNDLSTGYAKFVSPEIISSTTGTKTSAISQPFESNLNSNVYRNNNGRTTTTNKMLLEKLSSSCIDLYKDIKDFRKNILSTPSATTNLSTTNPVIAASFEETMKNLRTIVVKFESQSQKAEQYIKEYSQSDVLDFYRPSSDESIYSISLKYYGDPFNWRIIAERNNLSDTKFTGNELLIIPRSTNLEIE